MTTPPAPLPRPPPDYLRAGRGLRSWLTTPTTSGSGSCTWSRSRSSSCSRSALGVLIRLELLDPGHAVPDGAAYNRRAHAPRGHHDLPVHHPEHPGGLRELPPPPPPRARTTSPFPRLNLASWYLYVLGGLFAARLRRARRARTPGWTFYVPYSATTQANVLFPMLAAFILGWSSILTGLNFITTVHRLRAPGMTWFRMPLFVWGLYATAWIAVLATPVVGITLVLVLLERFLGVPIFDAARGGDPILYQHLFWIYSHPAVYIMVLPAMGVVSEIVPTFSRKTIFGYKFIAFSSMAIAAIGSLVWAHHMFTSGHGGRRRGWSSPS